ETWETYLLLFQTLAEAKQWTGAIAAWWQAITLDPYQGWWRYERCLSLSKTYHKLDELESLFRQEFKKNPGELDLGLNLSAILEQQGRLEEVYTLHQEIANYKLKQRCPDLSPQIPLKSPQVNFTIIGAQKSGTSSLYYYLEEHPNISVSIKKNYIFGRFTMKKVKPGIDRTSYPFQKVKCGEQVKRVRPILTLPKPRNGCITSIPT
ncbi:MAG: hypothetical protein R6U67_02060, partial [Sodalinema sp.]|uniref:hypothetical protein n=1 Tax=Sodalinema sp. TaxID=3080550 RepID=UPI00396F2DDA